MEVAGPLQLTPVQITQLRQIPVDDETRTVSDHSSTIWEMEMSNGVASSEAPVTPSAIIASKSSKSEEVSSLPNSYDNSASGDVGGAC